MTPPIRVSDVYTVDMSELIKDLSTLQFADYNPRIMKEHADTTLGKTMDKFGDLGGIVNNVATGRLVSGHQRVRKLREKYGDRVKIYVEQRFSEPDEYGTVALGFVGIEGTSVRWSYREVMWDEGLEKAGNRAANNVHGEDDEDKLAKLTYELTQLENGAELLDLAGETEATIQKALEAVGAVEPPVKPEPADKPDKLEFALTRDQRLRIERTLEIVKSTRDLQAIETASLNGSALFVICDEYLQAHENDPGSAAGERLDETPSI